jgi:hypothetical protein
MTLTGKHFAPAIGSHYKTQPSADEAHRVGTYTAEVQAKVASFEIVGVEAGHVLVKLPSGNIHYMRMDLGCVVEPPAPPRRLAEFQRQILNDLYQTDPERAAREAAGTDWTPPPTLDLTGIPDLRASVFQMMAKLSPGTAAEQLQAYRMSPEGHAEMRALAAQQATAQPQPQPQEAGAQLRAAFAGLLGGR